MNLDYERVALILADALVLGDGAASRKWCIATRTLRRYRALAREDSALAASVRAKNAEAEHDLATMRIAFLRDALKVMREKMQTASLYEVSGAVKIVGELHQIAMEVEDVRSDDPDPEAEGEQVQETATH